METANLRIKFTPLLNKALKNNSKCCLEIVPEVLCVQNLDKISWKQEKDSIEYSIPMTYKIIIKRREFPQEIKNIDLIELKKTYHSCVDLLPASSMTEIDYASGDVTRMISDTYILSNLKAEMDIDKLITNSDIPITKTHVTKNNETDSLKNMSVLGQPVNIVSYRENNFRNNNAFSSLDLDDSHCDVKNPTDKVTSTENEFNKLCKATLTQSAETITEISKRCDGSKRKLSVSPICSINTSDKPFPENIKDMPLNSIDDRDFSSSVALKLPVGNEACGRITDCDDNKLSLDSSIYKIHQRVLPEAQVAKFIKTMEREIMPLQIMLNEILQKCATLGLSKYNRIAHNLILYKSVPSCKNQVIKYCKTEGQTKSNRVVYSIVFDG